MVLCETKVPLHWHFAPASLSAAVSQFGQIVRRTSLHNSRLDSRRNTNHANGSATADAMGNLNQKLPDVPCCATTPARKLTNQPPAKSMDTKTQTMPPMRRPCECAARATGHIWELLVE